MTTQFIRQNIKVTDFAINNSGIQINYLMQGQIKFIELNPVEATKKMAAYDIIDDYDTETYMIEHGGLSYTWNQFVEEVGLWQYAALLIAINHELHCRVKAVSPRPLFEQIAAITKPESVNR